MDLFYITSRLFLSVSVEDSFLRYLDWIGLDRTGLARLIVWRTLFVVTFCCFYCHYYYYCYSSW